MYTAHKATPYAREYNYKNETGFKSIDFSLSHGLQLQIAEVLGEALLEETGTYDLHDIVSEVVDSCMPAYYTDIMDEWRFANCPDPEDSDHDPNSGPVIFGLMTRALYEAMAQFAWGVVGDSETPAEALERLNVIYPYKND